MVSASPEVVVGIEPPSSEQIVVAHGVTVLDERVVDDGDRITAGALTAGLDLGLWITERPSDPDGGGGGSGTRPRVAGCGASGRGPGGIGH
ncbi:hypothetical protein Pa4123_16350 [Phytohabitans aurantiacus]|uniref:SAF domain-containing protein n=1 Tax=Phytohabitans aurantiacus TaxID=3016789 RepID=A0ABQ5QR79_9ACTN|nr:hypothetical protein Pa4123_16350 [Phytohabitans aurantiacus]